MSRWLALWVLVMLPAHAHELQLASVRFDEMAGGEVRATLSVPLARDGQPSAIVPRFDARCRLTGEARAVREQQRILREWQLQCEGGLAGTRIELQGLDPRTPEALVVANFADGDRSTLSLDRHDPALTLPTVHEAAAVPLMSYLPIGIEHILLGPDHLLFVLGLMLVVAASGASWRMLIAALTAFTLAHSLTLAMAMLGIWGLPPKPVEILIALSILLLALELAYASNRSSRPTLTLRRPWIVAFAFGLLHGFGFAGALSEIGLPEDARGWALLLFNLGVEIGQLIFVIFILLLMNLLRALRTLPRFSTALPVQFLGVIAAYWTLDRISVWLYASGL